ncbi:EAL domain-containing protein [Kushneria sp. TE3]|uniref:bifunctional diguanylate cyclase/phosphodiesterase n=1 Tax=Kushneria sp. TE3 TaxID=3449832 RepID=UPI003F684848
MLTSLLLVGMATVYTLENRSALTHQFQDVQKEGYSRQAREIELSIKRSSDGLQQLATIVASTNELGRAVLNHDKNEVSDIIGSQWPALQLNAGVDNIIVFDDDNIALSQWGTAQQSVADPQHSIWLKNVTSNDTPQDGLICAIDCRQYSIVPVLQDGKSIGSVLISRSLADVTLYARHSFESNVALIISNPVKVEKDSHYIKRWGSSVVALTNEDVELSVLKAIAEKLPLGKIQKSVNRIKLENHDYEVSIFPIENDPAYSGKSFFMIFSDITSQVNSIDKSTRNTFLIALLGWLAAEVLLFAILWRPMARLRELAEVLPALASGGFAQVREKLNQHKHLWKDEIFILDKTALNVAGQLEKLEEEVESKRVQLSSRLKELAKDRDFISGLLNTANVLILTQDSNGVVTLVNQYARGITGLEDGELLGKRFCDIFGDSTVRSLEGGSSESTLLTSDGQEIIITWVHAASSDDVSSYISVGLDITARKHAERRLEWLAHRDPLTELYNRRYFRERLEKEIENNNRCAILYLDLDQFKEVNELSGHHSGDRLLCLVANTLSSLFSMDATIARQGGDEFSVLLANTDGEKAGKEAQKITEAFDKIEFFENGRRHRASASIGIALYPEHGLNETDLMANADLAMYKAKESGITRWHLLSSKNRSKEELKKRVYWSEKVRFALENNEFEMLLQPIASINGLDVKHYEMLVRMYDKNKKYIMPSVFIPIIERSGQIMELDRWVLRKGLKLIKTAPDSNVSFAVNVSGYTLHDKNLSSWLEQEIKESGADPRKLIIEVTETVAVTDFAAAGGVLERLRALGCRIALDDFGVGFSSFHYLGKLPSDFVKIDGSFIRNIKEDEESRLIVKAIAGVAKGFGKKVVAEFVEDPETIEILKEYDVDYVQGYYIGRPEKTSFYLGGGEW